MFESQRPQYLPRFCFIRACYSMVVLSSITQPVLAWLAIMTGLHTRCFRVQIHLVALFNLASTPSVRKRLSGCSLILFLQNNPHGSNSHTNLPISIFLLPCRHHLPQAQPSLGLNLSRALAGPAPPANYAATASRARPVLPRRRPEPPSPASISPPCDTGGRTR